jgi:hypothetical protein
MRRARSLISGNCFDFIRNRTFGSAPSSLEICGIRSGKVRLGWPSGSRRRSSVMSVAMGPVRLVCGLGEVRECTQSLNCFMSHS